MNVWRINLKQYRNRELCERREAAGFGSSILSSRRHYPFWRGRSQQTRQRSPGCPQRHQSTGPGRQLPAMAGSRVEFWSRLSPQPKPEGRGAPQRSASGAAARPLRPAPRSPPRLSARMRALLRASTCGGGVGEPGFRLRRRGSWRGGRLAEAARALPRAPARWPQSSRRGGPAGAETASHAAERVDVGRVRRPVAGGGRKMAAGRGEGS